MIDNSIFSVIVPVYNVEPYLEKCLQSILNQTFKNIEAILVYETSNDQSLSICQSFSEKYSNFRLHFGENKGSGAARNLGFNQACGKYICYVDSDDWIEPNLCSDMFAVMEETGADFINFGFDFINNYGRVVASKGRFSRKTLNGEDIFRKAMLDDEIFTVVWNKIYLRSFLIENHIYFPQVKRWEDILYSRKVAYFSENTRFISNIYYHQTFRLESKSRTISSDFLLEGISLLQLEHQFILNLKNGLKYENLFKAHFIKHISFYLIKAAFQIESWHEYLLCFKSIESSEYSLFIKESEVKALLPLKNRYAIFACKFPKSLRIISFILKKIGISPY